MDAKPQRPVRTLRVYGDENIISAVGSQKTLHSRNKSSPALSTMLQGAGLKAAAKRTAFGDVSNTANMARPSKDDSAISVKGDYNAIEKSAPTLQEKKPTTFLRPAQRPLSVSGLKNLLSNVSTSSHHVSVKQLLVENLPPSQSLQSTTQPANARKILSQKSNSVFKDAATKQPEQPAQQLTKLSASTAPILLQKSKAILKDVASSHFEQIVSEQTKSSRFPAPVAPVHRELLPRQISNPSEDAVGPQPKLRRTQSKYMDVPEVREEIALHATAETTSEDAPVLRSDGIYNDVQGQAQQYECSSEVKRAEDLIDLTGTAMLPQAKTKIEIGNPGLEQLLQSQVVRLQPEPVQKQSLAPVFEPEEYWDEEDAAENYDEEGYVTARSFKSRGDNTTGGATTLLFPKVTQKANKELAAAKDLIEGSKTTEDLEDEAWDTTMVAEYGEEIFSYMKDLEIKMLPNAHYMDNQTEIQWSMRSVLMDWIVQVHHRFSLLPETLFLCVNYIDRFLSCKVVSLGKLQLVGATAIFIAAKYEEIDCPSVQEIVYMVDGGYTVDEILKAERFMLSMLQFELGWPGPMSFLRRISKADDYDLETRTLAKYFLEITIMDERFVGSPPSFVAAGAHCLARMMLRKGTWSPAHMYYSNYTYSQLFSVVLLMIECCEDARKHHSAVFDKYTDKRYKRASYFAESEMKQGFQVSDVASNGAPVFDNFYDDRRLWSQS